MSYKITFTELNNPNKPPITVVDQALDTSTSLTFIGKNYAGYAPLIAENFLHLLENFASPAANPPINPVQGQLWYDNTNNLLKVYDGTGWTPAGAIKKSSTQPSSANIGDLWVNIQTSQLYTWSGASWILVGPQFSSSSQTGPVAEEIVDTSNQTHYVITLYSANSKVAIVSTDSFIPKVSLNGFPVINKGINLYGTTDPLTSTTTAGLWGTASNASSLLVDSTSVPAANFLRSDVTSVSNSKLIIQNNDGIVLGADKSFQIKTTGVTSQFFSNTSGNKVEFLLVDSGNSTNTVLHIDPSGKLGVNNQSPSAALDIIGGIKATGTASIGGSVTLGAGLSVTGITVLTGNTNVNGILTITPRTAGPAILPAASLQYDIGSNTARFRNIYAENFVGNFSGTFAGYVTGAIDGSATQLANPTIFKLQGDVVSNSISFNGASADGTATFSTVIGNSFVTGKTPAADSSTLTSAFPDQLVVYQQGTQSLVQMSKTTFFNHVPLVPIGCIFPFAGTADKIPAGYLLCDGAEVLQTTYNLLYKIIGYTYSNGTPSGLLGIGTFKLPDLRGRFPLGADNMNNGIQVPSSGGPTVPTVGTTANRVSDTSASNIGSGSPSTTGPGSSKVSLSVSQLPQHTHNLKTAADQYYALGDSATAADTDTNTRPGYGLSSTTTGGRGLNNAGSVLDPSSGATVTGQAINIMNPYLTINYIIYTGVN
jgi:microcystin-dependent protein